MVNICDEICYMEHNRPKDRQREYNILHASVHFGKGVSYSLNQSNLYEELRIILSIENFLFLCINLEDGKLITIHNNNNNKRLLHKYIKVHNNQYYYSTEDINQFFTPGYDPLRAIRN